MEPTIEITEKKPNGALIGSIIIIIILILGGLYLWTSKMSENKEADALQDILESGDTETIQTYTDLNSLEQEIGAEDMEVSADLNNILNE